MDEKIGLSVATVAGIGVFRFSGSLGVFHVETLQRRVLEAVEREGYGRVVFSFADLRFVDSAVAGALVGLQERLRGQVEIRLSGVRGHVQETFAYGNVLPRFRIYPSEEAALASFES